MVPQIFEFSLKDNSINKNIILEKLPDLDADYDDLENKLKNINTKINFSSENKEIEIFENNKNELVLKVKERTSNKIRIAVLGSCYSRNMFNSGEYFNPNYKDIYDVVFTQFHSSVISAVSSPVNLNYSSEKYIKDSQLQYVKRDFQKIFLMS